MSARTDARRAALRDTLIDLAEAQIKAEGLGSLRARSLAALAGCSVGTIYTVFSDMSGLAQAVNGRTFHRLAAVMAEAVAAVEGASPKHRLVAMSLAYLDFAAENTALWRALFDLDMADEGPLPQGYTKALEGLFAHVAAPLAELNPDLDVQALDLLTRGMFSAVHGIVLLGLEQRFANVPRDQLEVMIAQVLNKLS